MAISILQQDGSGYVQADVSDSVVVTPGNGNRRFILVCLSESGTDNTVSATLDGNALSVVSDGTTSADHEEGGFARVTVLELRQVNMSRNGNRDLEITWGTPGDDHAAYWFLLDGVDQGEDATDVLAIGDGTTGTGNSGTVTASDAGSFLVVGAYKNNADTSLNLVEPSGATEDQVVDASGGGAEFLVGHQLGSLTDGSNDVEQDGASSNRHVLVAVAFAPAVDDPAGESHTLGRPSLSLVSDWLEKRLPTVGDYLCRVEIDINRNIEFTVELWDGDTLQTSPSPVAVGAGQPELHEVAFTTPVADTDVRVAITDVTGNLNGISLDIECELFTDAGEVP